MDPRWSPGRSQLTVVNYARHVNDWASSVEQFRSEDVLAEEAAAQFPVSGLFARSITKTKQRKWPFANDATRENRRKRPATRLAGTGAAVFTELSDTNWKFNAGILIMGIEHTMLDKHAQVIQSRFDLIRPTPDNPDEGSPCVPTFVDRLWSK